MASFKTSCMYCGKDYTAHRTTSQFCSAKCRQRSHRKHENNIHVYHDLENSIDALRRLMTASPDTLLENSDRFSVIKELVLEIDLIIGMEADRIYQNNS